MPMELEQKARISFSFGRKYNLGNYESMDVHMSMSSDVMGTPGKTMEALQDVVYEWVNEFEEEHDIGKKKKRK